MVAVGETILGWKLGRGRGSRLYSGDSRNRRAVCASTVPMVNNLYQGMPLDPVTGLYYERARWYSSARAVLRQEPKSRYTSGAVHREISQDPAGYINGADTYQFVESDPVGKADQWGMSPLPFGPPMPTMPAPPQIPAPYGVPPSPLRLPSAPVGPMSPYAVVSLTKKDSGTFGPLGTWKSEISLKYDPYVNITSAAGLPGEPLPSVPLTGYASISLDSVQLSLAASTSGSATVKVSGGTTLLNLNLNGYLQGSVSLNQQLLHELNPDLSVGASANLSGNHDVVGTISITAPLNNYRMFTASAVIDIHISRCLLSATTSVQQDKSNISEVLDITYKF